MDIHIFLAANDHQPRPTIIIVGGGDACGEEAYLMAGVPLALERGFNVLVFHGPGQRGLLLRHPKQTFRPDLENWRPGFANWVGRRMMGKTAIHRATAELYMFWTNGISNFADYLRTIKSYNIYGLEAQITCPVLVVQGEGAGAVPFSVKFDAAAMSTCAWVLLG